MKQNIQPDKFVYASPDDIIMVGKNRISLILAELISEPIDEENGEDVFRNVAYNIMLKYNLRTPVAAYHLTEIEFYLFSENHQDKSTHGHVLQMKNSHWYFHRHGKTNSIKSGNRKGVDIVFGNEKSHGGILIRGIQNVANDMDYVYGPSKVVDRIMEDANIRSVPNLEAIEQQEVSSNAVLSIQRSKTGLTEEVIACPRHGLGSNATVALKEKGYRFLIYPHKEHKGKEKEIIPYLKERNHYTHEQLLNMFKRKTI
jgi:hypothetical protein